MKMKFIKNVESLAWLEERLEQFQTSFECSAKSCEIVLDLLSKITSARSSANAEKLKAQVAKHLASLEWDYIGCFSYSYEEELEQTVKLMKEAFGQTEEEEMQIPDFAPPAA